jgi:hypothetical protein
LKRLGKFDLSLTHRTRKKDNITDRSAMMRGSNLKRLRGQRRTLVDDGLLAASA